MSLGQVILITGPTAAGKTELAMKLYDRLGGAKNAHLVSVDSAMVYRGLDIGTAKPQGEVLAQYPHSLIDVIIRERKVLTFLIQRWLASLLSVFLGSS